MEQGSEFPESMQVGLALTSPTGFFSLDRSLEVNLLVISSKKEQRFDRVWLRVHIQKKKRKRYRRMGWFDARKET
jgi:hypothetical protein